MTEEKTSIEYKDKFQLFFVEMFWRDSSDPIYKNWTEGRIEIRAWGDQYSNDEVRYCTKKTKEWFSFQEHYSGKWVTTEELKIFKEKVLSDFKKNPTN